MIRLLALDLDGTLIGGNLAISPRTRKAITAARAQGVHVSIVTGRNWVTTQPYAQELGLDDPQVVFNGAVVTANGNGGTLYAHPLEWALIDELVAIARREDLFLELHTMARCYIEHLGIEAAFQAIKSDEERIVVCLDSLDHAVPVFKAQFIVLHEEQRQRLMAAASLLQGASLSWGMATTFTGWYANVMPSGQDKDLGLDIVLRHLGLAWNEVLAAGDSPSDLGYICRAGLGYVMGNAPEEMRRTASLVAPPVEEDGIAQVIEQRLLEGQPV